ncbi:MAG: Asp-tRNA(Asn)/Glu-tRNA(Gln) amidotransferase subunit GatA [Gammaproteobacteria bacterium]|nr:Asp-tRNA(Asn)/Glu-tRNA(Gln) amidotransferase subunit GatA [Gammaproteobacteria bacterium]
MTSHFNPFNTIAELSSQLAKKTISSVELTTEYLQRIKKYDSQINSYITVCEDHALAQAKAADQKLATDSNNHNKSVLTGIPIAQKDIFCTKNIKTSCGSKMLDNFYSPYDATVIEKFNTAGAVMLGKTNMDEFAMGSSNETSYYGPVSNPWDTQTVPGGSSGGSAAAVAAGLAPAATATDTGGSIRQPAAFCGLTGIKPSYGLVSRFGMIAFASSLDQGGIITRTAEDAALLLETMSGFDPQDSTSLQIEIPKYSQLLENNNIIKPISELKIGIPTEFFNKGLNPKIADNIHQALNTLEKLGAKLCEISLPNSHLAIPVYYVVAPAECSSNLSRFDGVRFGYRCADPKDLEDLYKRSRAEGFGSEVKRRIMIGTYVLSAGFYDAYYIKAQQLRKIISDDFTAAFEQVDLIAGPTTPTTAFKKGEKSDDPISMYLNDLYTSSANLAGLPGISVCSGFVDDLPVGLQLIGNYLSEASLLYTAHQYQKQTDWHTKAPAVFK